MFLTLAAEGRERDTGTVSSTRPGMGVMTTTVRGTQTRLMTVTRSPALSGLRGVTGLLVLSPAEVDCSSEPESVSFLYRERRVVRESPSSPDSATLTSVLSGQTSLTGQNALLGRFT